MEGKLSALEEKANEGRWQLPLGAQVTENGVRFRVWAAGVEQAEVVLFEAGQEAGSYPLKRDETGYFLGQVENARAGTRYMYRLDGDKLRPDPASRYQPEGIHGPSEVVNASAFEWHDEGWQGKPLGEMIIYEVHIGTATPEGTFEAFIEKLEYLKWLGVTAIELMPIGDFPGDRNWGYDGVDLFAPARAYGKPEDLRRLVDAAHQQGLAVIQDVVYNHLGPDGNYLRDFSREYFTNKEKTPWGDALNYACREVREFFIANALYWAHEFHFDGLRLDATHTILDSSEEQFLQELAGRVRASLPPLANRHFVVIAEDERNEAKLVQSPEEGGYGLDAVWADDFHHQVRSATAGDNEGYFADFTGKAEDVAETLRQGWFYVGQTSGFSGQARGTDASQLSPAQFVYCIQNHDQIGNRAIGDRLTESVDAETYRAASGLLLLSPYTPMLFQGQEWAASTPFLYFTDHEAELGRMVTEGRRAEFSHFSGFGGEEVPDPQARSTFEASKLNWAEMSQGAHEQTLALYHHLLDLRRHLTLLQERSRANFDARAVAVAAIALRYQPGQSEEAVLVMVNLKGNLDLRLSAQAITCPPPHSHWEVIFSTNDLRYGGADDLAAIQQEVQLDQLLADCPVTLVLRATRQ